MTEDERLSIAVDRLGLRVTRVERVPESNSSIVRLLHLDDATTVVLKLPWSPVKHRREMAALTALRQFDGFPRLLDHLDDDPCALLLSRIPGVPLPDATNCAASMAHVVGVLVARVHTVTMAGEAPETARAEWWPRLRELFAQSIEVCRVEEPHDDWDRAAALFDRATSAQAAPAAIGVVHFDTRPGNVLVDDGHVTGLIDFESARNGDPAMDFVKLESEFLALRAELRTALFAGYASVRPMPENLAAVLPAYRLYHAVVGAGWSLRRGRGSDAFHRLNRDRLRSLLTSDGSEGRAELGSTPE